MVALYSEKAAKFCEIFPAVLLTTVHTVKSKGKISQNFVAFSDYMNFKTTFEKSMNSFVKTILESLVDHLLSLKNFCNQLRTKILNVVSRTTFFCHYTHLHFHWRRY